ncbi:hypothetical protein [Listeria booriae]|uniref:hypothetical protein n=1 Tax=Listeria booriae TaxID=1552123 RepID=UPI0016277D97|nr:hypothetical protein [Listeria booriae]MBC2258872.1 hypothetical protein [Listeria booriae]
MEQVSLRIIIDGESAKRLLAAGTQDILNHFIPKGLIVNKSDIKVVEFASFDKIEKDKNSLYLGTHYDKPYYRSQERTKDDEM